MYKRVSLIIVSIFIFLTGCSNSEKWIDNTYFGDNFYIDNIQISPDDYIETYYASPQDTVISIADTFTQVAGNFTVHENRNFSVDNTTITYNGTRSRMFVVIIAVSFSSDAANVVLHWSLFDKMVEHVSGQAQDFLGAIPGDVTAITITNIIQLSPGDTMTVRVACNKTNTLTAEHLTFNAFTLN